MPDDYQTGGTATQADAGMTELLKGLGVDLSGSSTQTSTAQSGTTEDDGQTQPQVGTTGTADNADAQASTTTEAKPEDPANALRAQKANQAFAEMRATNAQFKETFNQLKEAMGFTGTDAEFHEHLKNISYAQKAKKQGQGVDPNLLRRLDDLERHNKMLEEQNSKNMFASNLKNLQTEFNLTDNEVREFVQMAIDEHIDLTTQSNFKYLYRGVYFDKLVDKKVEEERQKWLSAQAKGQTQATAPDGKSGKTDPSPTDVNTMAEFTSLLNNLPK